MARADLASRDLTLGGIRRALFQLLARFPVYRTYAGACGRSVQDREVFRYAAEAAREDLDEADRAVLDHLERWLGGQPLRELPPGPLRRLRGELLARFQQLSSPTAAKAVEDTACYRSAALLSRNDVGFDPQRFAASAEEFHAACEARRLASPRALLATASHDHKRGEDARARLAALSELAPWFARNVEHWQSLATPLRRDLAEGPAPSPGDELILFQALLGSWPLDAPCDGAALTKRSSRGCANGNARPCAKPSCARAGPRPTKTTSAPAPTIWNSSCARRWPRPCASRWATRRRD